MFLIWFQMFDRTLRLFSKKKDLAEFKRVYDSIDSLTAPKSESIKSSSNSKEAANMKPNGPAVESVIIDTKKISHQLGARIGEHPTSTDLNSGRKRRLKSKAALKKLEQELVNEKSHMSASRQCIQENESSMNPACTSSTSSRSEQISEHQISRTSRLKLAANESKPLNQAVFGVALSSIMQRTGQPLPCQVLQAMKFIRRIAQQEVGIFRKNGVKTRINRLKELIDKSEPICFDANEFTVFDVADTIKLYFRELPECLLTNKLSDILLTNYNSKTLVEKNVLLKFFLNELSRLEILPDERKIMLQQLMLLIPDENRMVLQTLLLFLNEIAKHNKINQVSYFEDYFFKVIFLSNFIFS